MFKRYAIMDTRDITSAIEKREQDRAENSHDFSHDSLLPLIRKANLKPEV